MFSNLGLGATFTGPNFFRGAWGPLLQKKISFYFFYFQIAIYKREQKEKSDMLSPLQV